MAHVIKWEGNNVIWSFHGRVTVEEILGLLERSTKDPRFPEQSYRLTDFTLVTDVDVSGVDVELIAAVQKTSDRLNPDVKGAIVVKEGMIESLATLYQSLASVGSSRQIEIFYNLSDAIEWAHQFHTT